MSSHAYENKTHTWVSQVAFLPRANRGPSGDTIEASGSTWAPAAPPAPLCAAGAEVNAKESPSHSVKQPPTPQGKPSQ